MKKYWRFVYLLVFILPLSISGKFAGRVIQKTVLAPPFPADTSFPNISNDYIQAVISTEAGVEGRFTLGNIGGDPDNPNDDDKKLLYGHPNPTLFTATSWTAIRIDSTNYVFGNGGNWITAPCKQGENLVASWKINHIVITQTLSITKSFSTGREDNLEIKYEIKNEDTNPHTIGIRPMLDTMLGDNDGAPFRVLGKGEVRTETEWVSPFDTIPQYCQVFDNFDNPTVISMLSVTGIGFPEPDRLILGYWPTMTSSSWDYIIDPTRDFLDYFEDGTIEGSSPDSDSAVLIYWNPTTLAPGESKTYGISYGLGGMTYVEWNPFNIGLSAPEFLKLSGKEYVPNPFTTVCYLKNSSGHTVTGATVKFNLTPGLVFDTGETAEKSLGTVAEDKIIQRDWKIEALGTMCGYLDLSITCYAEGKSKTVTRQIYIPALPNSIHGRVTNCNVQPLPNATINVLHKGALVATTTPFSDGTFLIEDLPAGNYELVVTAPGYADRTMPVDVGSDKDTENTNIVLFRPYEDEEKLEAFCYPNPTRKNPARFVFYTEEQAAVKVELFTVTGKRIKTYNINTSGKGYYEVEWDIEEVANGVYLYRITANWGGKERSVIKKIAIIKN